MNVLERPVCEAQSLGVLLRRSRMRLDPQTIALGWFPRLPSRIGKSVTQEEIAEAAGISRQWYMMMENGRANRVSPIVLARVAEALMLNRAERKALFRFGIPELCAG